MKRVATSLVFALLASASFLQAQDVIRDVISPEGFAAYCCHENSPTITAVDGRVYFHTYDPLQENDEFWRSDGTQEGTERLGFATNLGGFTAVGSTLYYVSSPPDPSDNSPRALGKHPGGLVKRFDATEFPNLEELWVHQLTDVGGTLFFAVTEQGFITSLWKSDGTEASTVRVRDIGAPIAPAQSTALGDLLFFEAVTYSGGLPVSGELWVSDGTEAGTTPLLDGQGRPITNPAELLAVGPSLFFAADDPSGSGRALWRSDGSPAGTEVVRGGFPADAGFDAFAAQGQTLFFSVDDGASGQELWKSDGTETGTVLVKDLVPGPEGSDPVELVAVGPVLFFGAGDPSGTGSALWKSDGTGAGTVVVRSGFPAGAAFGEFTDLLGTLYFTADDGVHGRELWKSDGTEDGTEDGTRLVADLRSGPASAFDPIRLLGDLTATGGKLFFAAAPDPFGRIRTMVLVPVPGLVAHWPFNEGTGDTAADSSGNAPDGALLGDPTWADGYPIFGTSAPPGPQGRPGFTYPLGTSLAFDGQDDLVSVPGDPALDLTAGLTLMAWFKHSAAGGGPGAGIEKGDAYRLAVVENDQAQSHWRFELWNAAGTRYQLDAPAAAYNDVWHHVAGTFDGQQMMLYVDGTLVASQAAQGPPRTTAQPLEVGRSGGSAYYAGQIDEVHLYDQALSQEEIRVVRSALRVQPCFTAAPMEGPAPLTVTFDLACTVRPADFTLAVSWEFGDGSSESTYVDDLSGAVFEHTYAEPGTYTARAFVEPSDPAGGASLLYEVTRTVEVTGGGSGASGPLAYWPLDERSTGTAPDATGSGLDAQALGALRPLAGQLGSARFFDGEDDALVVAHDPRLDLTDALTLAGWFYRQRGSFDATGIEKQRTYRLLSKKTDGDPDRAHWFFDLWNDQGAFFRLTSTQTLPNDAWHHVAATFDGQQMRLYFDGVLEASQPAEGPVRVLGTPFEMGRRDGQKYYRGRIDEVVLFDRALSAEEIAALSRGEVPGEASEAALAEAGAVAAGKAALKEAPAAYELEGNYPNPFNPSTTVRYALAEASPVALEVYDVLGRRVAVLVEAVQEAGRYEAVWDGRSEAGELVAGGVYVARLQAGSFEAVRTMVLVK